MSIVRAHTEADWRIFSDRRIVTVAIFRYPALLAITLQFLERVLQLERFAFGDAVAGRHDAFRLVHTHELGALAPDVQPEALLQIVGDARIPGAALAFDDIDAPIPGHIRLPQKDWPRTPKGCAARLLQCQVTCGWSR